MLTIFFVFIICVPASYIFAKYSDFCENDFIKNFSDFGYTKYMPFEHCEHVYRDAIQNPCPKCNGEAHITDFEEIHRQHREWISSGKAVAQGWWSI